MARRPRPEKPVAWTPARLPSLEGRTFLITGGNGGLGRAAATLLAARGARVVITARSAAKADDALRQIRAAAPGASVSWQPLDLARLESVAAAAAALSTTLDRLDAVINNAGVMQTPPRRTADGFELQLGTNHLGHFRLNSLLMGILEKSAGRIVAVSSVAHRLGRIHLDDLQLDRGYGPTKAYAQSKLANLLYAVELQRRLAARSSAVTALACHPGYADTNLQSAGVGMAGGSRLLRWGYRLSNALLAQSAERGAWPLVLAAADPAAEPGAYYGPTETFDTRGAVGRSTVARHAQDAAVAARLFDASEALVGPFFS